MVAPVAPADVQDIREALRLRLATVAGLEHKAYSRIPAKPTPPFAYVGRAEIFPHHTAGIGQAQHRYEFEVFVLTLIGTTRTAQDNMTAWLAMNGDRSVYRALMGSNTLGGLVSTVTVARTGPVVEDTFDVAGSIYWGAQYPVTVVG